MILEKFKRYCVHTGIGENWGWAVYYETYWYDEDNKKIEQNVQEVWDEDKWVPWVK